MNSGNNVRKFNSKPKKIVGCLVTFFYGVSDDKGGNLMVSIGGMGNGGGNNLNMWEV